MSLPLSPRHALLKGALWTLATRWSIKGIGFLNTVIMARLLLPADYGLVALATLLVGAIQTLLDFGASTALLRKREVCDDEVHSAWSLRLLQCLGGALLVALLAPLAAWGYGKPELSKLLWALAAGLALLGLQSMAPTLALRQFNFRLDYQVNVSAKVVSVAVTLAGGWYWGDYRALVSGILAGQLSTVLAGYLLHPYRPRWCSRHMGEIWGITKWLMLGNIGTYLLRKGDELIAARIGSTHQYGLYHVGADLGSMPIAEVGPGLLRALLPVMASIREDGARLQAALVKTVSGLNGVIWLLAALVVPLAPEITRVVLGPQWTEAAFYVAWFAVLTCVQTALMPVRSFLTLLGETRSQTATVASELLVFLVAALLLVPGQGLPGLVYARLLGSLANGWHLLVQLKRHGGGLRRRQLLPAWGRPLFSFLLAVLAAGAVLRGADGLVPRLLLGGASAAITYLLLLGLSWHLFNRPEGLESMALERLRRRSRS